MPRVCDVEQFRKTSTTADEGKTAFDMQDPDQRFTTEMETRMPAGRSWLITRPTSCGLASRSNRTFYFIDKGAQRDIPRDNGWRP
jgi:hypothetical protein